MFERFTDLARKVMALTNQEAQRLGHPYIGTEHILLGLVREGSGVGANLIKNSGIELRKVRLEVEKLIKAGPDTVAAGGLPRTPRAKKVIELAIQEAHDLNHSYVGTEHILLGLLKEDQGTAYVALSIAGLSYGQARKRLIELDTAEWVDSTDSKVDPKIAALKELLPERGPCNIQPNDGGAFEVVARGSSAKIVHWLVTQIDLTPDDLAKDAPDQAAAAMRTTADRLEKAAAQLRESAATLSA